MREQLDGGDVGVGIGDAPRHQRARVGLRHGDRAQPRHEVPHRKQINHQPAHEGRQQPEVKIADHQGNGDEVDDHEHQDVGQYHPGIAHRERGLHDLGRHAPGELVLVEAQGLRQHVAVEIPAQPHGEIAGERLLLEQALQSDQHRAAASTPAKQQQVAALLGPQPRRLHLGQPIDDMAQHAEQQRLEHADRRGQQCHRRDVAAHAARAGPQERKEPARQHRRRRVRIRRDEFFEVVKHAAHKPGPGALARDLTGMRRIVSEKRLRNEAQPDSLKPQIANAAIVARKVLKRVEPIEMIDGKRCNRLWRREP